MIQINLRSRCCNSDNLIKNGTKGVGNAKTKCKDCGFGGVINTKRTSEGDKEKAVKCYLERSSLRRIARVFNVSDSTINSSVRFQKK